METMTGYCTNCGHKKYANLTHHCSTTPTCATCEPGKSLLTSFHYEHISVLIREKKNLLAILRRIPIATLNAESGEGFVCLGCGSGGQDECQPGCWAHDVEEASYVYDTTVQG